ncbi:MAG: gamma carbonic anhydrase family protein, partial [Clostridia bacterium]|nr:gamma carbonic anhydrase family protein [Clostridia bacterium]
MIQSVNEHYPEVPDSAYVHPSAVVIGNVTLGANANVWPNAVLRGDLKNIDIGENTNVQDGSVLHTGKYNLSIGDNVLVGHN